MPLVARLAETFTWPAPLPWTGATRVHRNGWRIVPVEDVHRETAVAATLTLRVGRRWPYRAGQYVTVAPLIDGRYVPRTYSISSAPERADGRITVTVKCLAGGRVSAHLVRETRPGDRVALGLASGNFALRDERFGGPIFITGGSGLTPVMSMVRSLAARGALADVDHVHYAPRADDVIFRDELLALARAHRGYRLYLRFTRPRAAGAPAHPRFGAEELTRLVPDWRTRFAYACGPASLLAAVERCWTAAGLGNRLHLERFTTDLQSAPGAGGEVRFVASGIAIRAAAGVSLLRLAEDAGLSPPSGCRIGICHTCPRVLRSGRVRDLRSGAVHGEPGDKVPLCVSAAAGDCEIEL